MRRPSHILFSVVGARKPVTAYGHLLSTAKLPDVVVK